MLTWSRLACLVSKTGRIIGLQGSLKPENMPARPDIKLTESIVGEQGTRCSCARSPTWSRARRSIPVGYPMRSSTATRTSS